MKSLLEAIISRDGCTENEAQELIDEMVIQVNDGYNPEDVLFDYGFEPDYIFDIM